MHFFATQFAIEKFVARSETAESFHLDPQIMQILAIVGRFCETPN
jgi:hypothetical protein